MEINSWSDEVRYLTLCIIWTPASVASALELHFHGAFARVD